MNGAPLWHTERNQRHLINCLHFSNGSQVFGSVCGRGHSEPAISLKCVCMHILPIKRIILWPRIWIPFSPGPFWMWLIIYYIPFIWQTPQLGTTQPDRTFNQHQLIYIHNVRVWLIIIAISNQIGLNIQLIWNWCVLWAYMNDNNWYTCHPPR